MDQVTIFDAIHEAETRRDAALCAVDKHAAPEWKDEALEFLADYARGHEEVFVDQLWQAGMPRPREPKALGPLMRRAVKLGLIAHSGTFRPSTSSNMSAKPVWTSLVYGQ